MSRPVYKSNGFMLITATLALSIMSTICLGVAWWVRYHIAEENYRHGDGQLRRLAEDLLLWTAWKLDASTETGYSGFYEEVEADWFDSEVIKAELAIVPINAKFPLNKANRFLLQAALKDLAVSESEIEALVNAIEDWRGTAHHSMYSFSYASKKPPYDARFGPFRRLEELLYVEGITPELFHGEDSNRNGVLDPNEDDGVFSSPADNADGILQLGLYEYFHAHSFEKLYINGVRPHLWRPLMETLLFDARGSAEEMAKRIAQHRSGPDGIFGTEDDKLFESVNDLAQLLGNNGEMVVQRLESWLGIAWEAQGYEVYIRVALRQEAMLREFQATLLRDSAGKLAVSSYRSIL